MSSSDGDSFFVDKRGGASQPKIWSIWMMTFAAIAFFHLFLFEWLYYFFYLNIYIYRNINVVVNFSLNGFKLIFFFYFFRDNDIWVIALSHLFLFEYLYW
jgi:hypothetical protein